MGDAMYFDFTQYQKESSAAGTVIYYKYFLMVAQVQQDIQYSLNITDVNHSIENNLMEELTLVGWLVEQQSI